MGGFSYPAFELILLLISIIGGLVGSLFGLGGGMVIIPAMTLYFGIPLPYAAGASIVSVIATSSGSAVGYLKDRITNIRVAMLLEVATTLGAYFGVWISSYLAPQFLYALFAAIQLYSAFSMLRTREENIIPTALPTDLGVRLRLNSSYPDQSLKREVPYVVRNVPLGLALMTGAGMISGLLGIGSGSLKVPAMDKAMKLPMKVSSATSNFMMGVTASASAGSFFMRGHILPGLAAPVALGVLCGAWIGARIMNRLPSRLIRIGFVIFLLILSVQMTLKAWRIHVSA